MLTFTPKYFFLAVVLFIVEVLIALFVHDSLIRPYFGDYLVVFLIYYAVRALVDAPPLKLAIGTLLFAYTVEVLQYVNLVDRLGLTDNLLAKTVLGYGFEWWDLLAYTLGILTLLLLEKRGSVVTSTEYPHD